MNISNPQQFENYIDDPTLMPVAEEKYSNLKIYDQKPIYYKDSPFESRKESRKNLVNEDGSLVKNNIVNDANSEFSEERSEGANKYRKNNPMMNYTNDPLYNVEKNYKKMKTYQNVQNKTNFLNPLPIKNPKQTTQINNRQNIQQNISQQQIIYMDQNQLNYNQVPQQKKIQQNLMYSKTYVPNYQNPQKIPAEQINTRQRVPDEKVSHRTSSPRDTKVKKKINKNKIEITKKQQNYKTNEDAENPNNESSLSNVSFNNRNINTNISNNLHKNSNQKNKEGYNNIEG